MKVIQKHDIILHPKKMNMNFWHIQDEIYQQTLKIFAFIFLISTTGELEYHN